MTAIRFIPILILFEFVFLEGASKAGCSILEIGMELNPYLYVGFRCVQVD